jgi:hypothetical protein
LVDGTDPSPASAMASKAPAVRQSAQESYVMFDFAIGFVTASILALGGFAFVFSRLGEFWSKE